MGEDTFTPALSAAVSEAAMAGMDLRTAAEVLERAREAARAGTIYTAAHLITALAAGVSDESLAGIVIRMRDQWFEAALQARVAEIREASGRDPDGGVELWLDAIGEAVAEFRFDAAATLAKAGPAAAALQEPRPETLARWARLAEHERWREARPLLAVLASRQTGSTIHRARATGMLAEIDAVVREDYGAATRAVEAAEKLAPDDWRVLYARARLLEEQDRDMAAADALCVAASEAAPQVALIVAHRGTTRAKRDDLAGAEALIQQSIGLAIGSADGYAALIELYGDARLFPDRRDRIGSLAERARLLSVTRQDSNAVALQTAAAFATNKEFDLALAWLARAETTMPGQIQAPTNRGYLHIDMDDPAAARQDFERVIELAPEALEGHWGLANLAEVVSDWPTLLRHAELTIRSAPEKRDAVTSRLKGVASTLMQNQPAPDPAIARAFYDGLRRLSGPDYEADYRNLLGNLAFYLTDYKEAIDHYRLAIAATPQPEARYYGNLAVALEALGEAAPSEEWTTADAIAAAVEANALAPGEQDYRNYLDRLAVEAAFTARCGPAARALKPDTARLRVHLSNDLLPHVVVAGDDGVQRLSPGFVRHIAGLRADVTAACRFTLPGIQVSDLPESEPGIWSLELGGERGPAHHVDASTRDALLATIEGAIRGSLPALLGHGEALQIVESCPACPPNLRGSSRLTEVVQRARALLGSTGRIDLPVACAALLDDLGQPATPAPASEAATEAARIELRTGPGTPDPSATWVEVQRAVFERTGVVIPAWSHVLDPEMPETYGQLLLDGAALAEAQPFSGEVSVDRLVAVADRLLGAAALRWQLKQLRSTAADLLAVMGATLSEAALLESLRERLRGGTSLRNLRHALEAIVLTARTADWKQVAMDADAVLARFVAEPLREVQPF